MHAGTYGIAVGHCFTILHASRAAHLPLHCPVAASAPCRLSDQGGGIAEEDMQRVWQFGFTTTSGKRRHGAFLCRCCCWLYMGQYGS